MTHLNSYEMQPFTLPAGFGEGDDAPPAVGLISVDPREHALECAKYYAENLHGDMVLVPFVDGQPDWPGTTRDTLTKLAGHHWSEIEVEDIPRLGVLTDSFAKFLDYGLGYGDDVSIITLWREGTPEVKQIDGEDCLIARHLIMEALIDDEPLKARQTKPDKPKDPPVVANDNKPKSRFRMTWFDDIAGRITKETIIKGVFGVREFTMVSGMPGSGKSVIMTDAACHVAAGREWHGRKVKQGLVIYVAAERQALTERRMMAFRKEHGVKDVPLLVLGGMIDLTTGLADADALATVINAAAKACDESCVWIIIDTLTRTFGPGDQHQSKDMAKFVRSCDRLSEKTGAHVTVIHHTGWSGDRGKGAIDLDGAVDASFMVKKSASGYTLECDGANDGDEGTICHFTMKSIEVGIDEDGEPTFAPVVIPSDGVSAGEHLVTTLKGHNAKALQILTEACRGTGSPIDEEDWREAFYAASPGDKPETLKVRFQRVRKALKDSGAVHYHEGTYWVTPDGTDGTCSATVPCSV
ncbi:hypothetical protein GCM10010869_00960 [Mesorhizobium tianshanense]|uniref:AAA domain-containing protein n=1 Tax=Mesorhizobium tianshanense TaxID=39844 RepID=A0A562NPD5_9HYPH|nr:AAA family ATPase [Mesorhizobium tianshanense]TWI34069.1 AAA domain-containing protein [Mesorhizobium tianshanense]GLS34508.1 hypothetical protein GCM10010869_00960 [Mesorhizobium tianshanense]